MTRNLWKAIAFKFSATHIFAALLTLVPLLLFVQIAYSSSSEETKLDTSKAVLGVVQSLKLDELKTPDDTLPYKPHQFASPTVYRGIAYICTTANGFFAIKVNTGKILWNYTPENVSCSSEPLVTEKAVFFGTDEGIVFALDPDSGKEIWKYQTDGRIVSKPVLVSERLVVSSENSKALALDAKGGELEWRVDGTRTVGMTILSSVGPLVLPENKVALPLGPGELATIDVETGATIWKTKLGRPVDFRDIGGGIIKVGNSLIVSVYNAGLFWVNAETGVVEREETRFSSPAGIAFDGKEHLAVATGNYRLFAMNISTNNIEWEYNYNSGYVKHPSFLGEVILAPNSKLGLFVHSAKDGKALQVLRGGYGFLSKPATFGDYVMLMSNGGYFYFFTTGIIPLTVRE